MKIVINNDRDKDLHDEMKYRLFKRAWMMSNFKALIVSLVILLISTPLLTFAYAMLFYLCICFALIFFNTIKGVRLAEKSIKTEALNRARNYMLLHTIIQCATVFIFYAVLLVPFGKALYVIDIFEDLNLSVKKWSGSSRSYDGISVKNLYHSNLLGRSDNSVLIDNESKLLVKDTFVISLSGSNEAYKIQLESGGIIFCKILQNHFTKDNEKIECAKNNLNLIINNPK
jgi:hypothetical protein